MRFTTIIIHSPVNRQLVIILSPKRNQNIIRRKRRKIKTEFSDRKEKNIKLFNGIGPHDIRVNKYLEAYILVAILFD